MDLLEELELKRAKRQELKDKLVEKVLSKKLLVWISVSIAFFLGKIDVDMWMTMNAIFVGTEGIVNAAHAFNKVPSSKRGG